MRILFMLPDDPEIHEAESSDEELEEDLDRGDRLHLPAKRSSVNYELRVDGRKAHVAVGLYPDGSVGEVRIDTAKDGTEAAVYRVLGRAISVGLQYGVPLEKYIRAFKEEGGTAGRIRCEGVPAIHGENVISFWAALGRLLEAECLLPEETDTSDI